MHVDITPRQLDVTPGQPALLTITVGNTGAVIGGYALRILGADPSWVELDETDLSLFPDETRVVNAKITVPNGIAAGERRVAVQVRELTPPESTLVEEIVLAVPEARSVDLRVDPFAVTAGRAARFSLLVDNTGNTPISGRLTGGDPEGRVDFRFQPATLSLAPGEHAVVDLRARAKRPFTGSPTVRVLGLGLAEPGPDGEIPPEPPRPRRLGRRRRRNEDATPAASGDDDRPPLTNATFVQKALLTRGPLSLLGLLAAITVFAVVITLALSRIVGQSTADRNLALEIAAARDSAATSGSSSVAGQVSLLTSGTPVPGVAVGVFDASDTDTPVATTATDEQGGYQVSGLPAGDYKLTFRGAGFVQLWYPQAVDPADAETITLDAKNKQSGLDVALGGVPASISGRVRGDDVSAATLTLKTPLGGTAGDAEPTAAAAEQGATVRSVPIGADGTFELTDVPSPSVYDLVVTKQGYATSTQRVDVTAGEKRDDVQLTLRQGDGVISGTVGSADGPLAGATVTATSGQTTVTTQSLTDGDVGAFTLRGLPTPATFTVVVSLADYASQTLTLTLADGQKLTGVATTLGSSSGSLRGSVVQQSDGAPAPGVLVTVTDGLQTVRTATQSKRTSSGDIGSWRVGGLSVPGTYTVTFDRGDLTSQTVSVGLDSSGEVTSDSQGATVTRDGITVGMQPSTGSVAGTVFQRSATSSARSAIGEVTVQLSSSSSTYTVTTASVPNGSRGKYRIERVPPGTYTVSVNRNGISPTSEIIQVTAGRTFPYSPVLAASASVSGKVVRPDGSSVGAGWVVELFRSSDYPDDAYRTTTTVGAGGTFTFDDVDAPEAYVVQVRRTRGSAPTGSRTLQLEASEQATVTVKVHADG